MVKSKYIGSLPDVKGLLLQDRDFLEDLVSELVQESQEAELNDELGACKNERAEQRNGYRSGYHSRAPCLYHSSWHARTSSSPKPSRPVFNQDFLCNQRSEKALVFTLAEHYMLL